MSMRQMAGKLYLEATRGSLRFDPRQFALPAALLKRA